MMSVALSDHPVCNPAPFPHTLRRASPRARNARAEWSSAATAVSAAVAASAGRPSAVSVSERAQSAPTALDGGDAAIHLEAVFACT